MGKERITYYTVDKILERTYKTIPLEGYWQEVIGDPEYGFWALVYALPKQGKSYFVTQLADALTEHLGRGVYWSCEEGVGYSVKKRLETLGIDGSDLRFVADSNKDLAERILENRTNRFLVIDSPEHLKMTGSEAKALFDKYHRKKTVIIVQHVNSSGGVKGGQVWEHLVDVIMQLDRPYVYQRGRYGGEPKTELPQFMGKMNTQKSLDL